MLDVKDINFHYPGKSSLFQGLCLELPEKGIFKVEGANGSGKTTLLRILATLIMPKGGEVNFCGKEITKDQVNYLSANESAFFDQMTGDEGIRLFSLLNNHPLEKSLAKSFLKHQLYDELKNIQFYQMSSGMKRLLLLSLCFSKPARIFLLDEPFVALDKELKAWVAKVLETLAKECLIIVTSHEDTHSLQYNGTYSMDDLR